MTIVWSHDRPPNLSPLLVEQIEVCLARQSLGPVTLGIATTYGVGYADAELVAGCWIVRRWHNPSSSQLAWGSPMYGIAEGDRAVMVVA